ncbi:SDR family NAD(P)-dependent oxidoreductase [Kribbella sp. NPDC050124]|uniref:SDR family NAD(P)-dependent oxidoreductase n=1 Tax=Kribbella sp. NPDC050124 TaxID=3364114 RepID=UPI0037A3548A
MSLTGKTALVTGASRGIGRAVAERLAADGARVAVHYGTNETAAKETVEVIAAAGGDAFAVPAEFGTDGAIDALYDGLVAGLDGAGLDILVNNAAIFDSADGIHDVTPEQFDRLIEVNVKAPLFLTQRVLPLIPDGGRIVNVSSGVTWFATRDIAYGMTKGALNVFTRSLARTLGPRGITVNTVSPGITETDMNTWLQEPGGAARVAAMVALGRHGQSADIADVIAFFASDEARWVTGEALETNGGLWLGPNDD